MVVRTASPRQPVANVNHHELFSNIAPEGQQQETLDPTSLLNHELKQQVDILTKRLLQSDARIETQLQALSDAAADAQAGRDAQMEVATLRHRTAALEAELQICRRHLEEHRAAVQHRDAAWSQHHSLERAVLERDEQLEQRDEEYERQLATVRAELRESREETAKVQQALAEAREQSKRWREALHEAQDMNRTLDARLVAVQQELESAKANARSIAAQEREWKKERSMLLREVDKNTTSSILRREELYFTRTNLLKEQLRLRGELERKPLPEPTPPSAEPPHRGWERSWELNPPDVEQAAIALKEQARGGGGGSSSPRRPQSPRASKPQSPRAGSKPQSPRAGSKPQSPRGGWGDWASVLGRGGSGGGGGNGPRAPESPRGASAAVSSAIAPAEAGAAAAGRGGEGGTAAAGEKPMLGDRMRQHELQRQERQQAEEREAARQRMVRTPTARPADPPPPNFVCGLSPRSPRSMERGVAFEQELMNEYRAASRASRYVGGKSLSGPVNSAMHARLDDAAREGASIAAAVGIEIDEV